MSKLSTPYYDNLKNDYFILEYFRQAVKMLATETGSLNKRLFRAYNGWLRNLSSDKIKEKDISEKLAYIENIFHDKNKCMYFRGGDGGYLHCHWTESKKLADYIFYIYNRINAIQNEE